MCKTLVTDAHNGAQRPCRHAGHPYCAAHFVPPDPEPFSVWKLASDRDDGFELAADRYAVIGGDEHEPSHSNRRFDVILADRWYHHLKPFGVLVTPLSAWSTVHQSHPLLICTAVWISERADRMDLEDIVLLWSRHPWAWTLGIPIFHALPEHDIHAFFSDLVRRRLNTRADLYVAIRRFPLRAE